MELLETQDPEKRKLIETSDRHKRALEKDLSDLTQKSDQMLKNALIIGGSLALTYLLISSLSKKKKKKKNTANVSQKTEMGTATVDQDEEESVPSIFGEVGTRIVNMGAVMLLDIAREKISEYLASRKKEDEHS
ncbi:MAG: hypothetical protein JNK10_01840 [Cyclobacteriaceae bacterium]|nr:hypothetical protein [Cyclobacteriaceae bacterium]